MATPDPATGRVYVEPTKRPGLAAILTLIATALAAASTLLAKGLTTGAFGPELNPLQASFARYIFAFLIISVVVILRRPRIDPPDWVAHMGRSGFGWVGVSLLFAAATFIPLADATAISFLSPMVAMALAVLFLGERVGRWRWAAAGIALAGTMILLRPTPAAFQPAALLALGAALALGTEMTFMKRLVRREGPLQILWINNGLGALIAVSPALFVWTPPTGLQWMALAGVALTMVTAQSFFVNAIARADSSFVAPFWYAMLVFAALYDGWIFGVWPGAVSLTGIAVILTGGAILFWREVSARSSTAERL